MSTLKVFLDINIGDEARYTQELAAYQRGVAFLSECGSQYGLTQDSPADLDEEAQQLLIESYDSDPNWSSKGIHMRQGGVAVVCGGVLSWGWCCGREAAWFLVRLCHELVLQATGHQIAAAAHTHAHTPLHTTPAHNRSHRSCVSQGAASNSCRAHRGRAVCQ